jgi:hypothetical protein
MSNSFSNQTIAQIELFTKTDEYPVGVYVLPKHLDEKVARLHLGALGVQLTELSKEQAACPGVAVEGPTSRTTTATDARDRRSHGKANRRLPPPVRFSVCRSPPQAARRLPQRPRGLVRGLPPGDPHQCLVPSHYHTLRA